MTKREALRQTTQENTLMSLGFTRDEAEALRRISMTLHRWSEHECNGTIERAGIDGDGLPYWSNPDSGRHMIARVPDRERGALKRLKAIVSARNERALAAIPLSDLRREQRKGGTGFTPLSFYIQGDPRGCALYILRPGDVPEGQRADSYYTRGIAVY